MNCNFSCIIEKVPSFVCFKSLRAYDSGDGYLNVKQNIFWQNMSLEEWTKF